MGIVMMRKDSDGGEEVLNMGKFEGKWDRERDGREDEEGIEGCENR